MPIYPVLHLTVEQALRSHPDLEIALSDRPIVGEIGRLDMLARRLPVLGRRFRDTMAEEDSRRPTMDVGLGVWTDDVQRYYPLEVVREAGDVIVDRLDGRSVVVYFEPGTRALLAAFVDARAGEWEGDVLRLDTGAEIRDGALYDASGGRQALERPLQLFTRWYGYALTFPDTEVYEVR